jgi:hypothetical protein
MGPSGSARRLSASRAQRCRSALHVRSACASVRKASCIILLFSHDSLLILNHELLVPELSSCRGDYFIRDFRAQCPHLNALGVPRSTPDAWHRLNATLPGDGDSGEVDSIA